MTVMNLKTVSAEQALDITRPVEDAVRASGVAEGLAVVYCPHTTAAVFVNEGADPDVAADVAAALARIAPREGPYRHAEGNSGAHIRSVLVGCSATIPIARGRLALGTWQKVFLAEFDGPRSRQVFVQVVG
ncbi:MAG: YjbQ family protein [Deltaproteobacteria bacterium]|nr:YjbQ family protein [Deltaproteobacteria bacterium]